MRSIYGLERHGYRIRLWDEASYDVQSSARVCEAYKTKRWSLVSNYVRLDVLQKHGGVYLDTDIEVVRPFDELLAYDFFLGFMWDCTLGTAVLGSVPNHPVLTDILRMYNEVPSQFKSPNNDTFTDYFLSSVPGFTLNGREQELSKIFVADKYVFEQPSLFKRKNYSIHHFEQSWKANSTAKTYVKSAVISLGSLWLYRKYVCWRSLLISPYYEIFRKVRAQERMSGFTPRVSRLRPNTLHVARSVRNILRRPPANDTRSSASTKAARVAHS